MAGKLPVQASSAPPFADLPRLRSLVVGELNTLSRAPFDKGLFAIVFVGVFFLLLGLAFGIPYFIKAHPVTVPLEAKTAGEEPVVHKADEKQKPSIIAASNDRQADAIKNNDNFTHQPLAPAPIDALEEMIGEGKLPRIADDGRKPSFAYSRPFDRTDPRPRITVLVAELGLSRLISEATIGDLPDAVTLVFSSFSPAAEAWMLRARSLGHETLLSVAMEPLDYPSSDPGPGTLLVQNNAKENIRRLHEQMVKGKGYVGLTSLSGSRFSTTPESLRPILDEVKKRGLLWFDARLSPLSSAQSLAHEMGTPAARADVTIADDSAQNAMNLLLQDAETSARQGGKALVLVHASPLTLRALAAWLKTLPEKGFALAPLSAVTE